MAARGQKQGLLPGSISLEEFAALAGIEADQIADWSAAGRLDPGASGRFDDST